MPFLQSHFHVLPILPFLLHLFQIFFFLKGNSVALKKSLLGTWSPLVAQKSWSCVFTSTISAILPWECGTVTVTFFPLLLQPGVQNHHNHFVSKKQLTLFPSSIDFAIQFISSSAYPKYYLTCFESRHFLMSGAAPTFDHADKYYSFEKASSIGLLSTTKPVTGTVPPKQSCQSDMAEDCMTHFHSVGLALHNLN